MNNGYTLAEVLITLGVIGIVSAITLPNLIFFYQNKVLESNFKKSYSNLLQALIYIEPSSLTLIGNNPQAGSNDSEFYTKLFTQYNILDDMNKKNIFGTVNTYKKVKSYAKITVDIPACMHVPQKIAVNGSAIGGMYNCFANWISIDTNGPRKGPNALGHDLFYFGITSEGKLIPLGEGIVYSFWNFSNIKYCSKNSTDILNGIGCTKYAIANKCPDDNTKTYWECLPH
ncbi:type II secretion system protein [bacterium]|nr:type II secretion system protein [bacterium]